MPKMREVTTFFREVAVLEYEKIPQKIRRTFKYGDLKLLEALHYDYISHQNELFWGVSEEFEMKFVALFTYHTNRQEGSRTTRKQVEEFMKSRVRKPKTWTERELFNSFRAYRYAVSSEMKWNLKHIKKVHKLLLEDLDPLIAGQWKNEDNVAPGNQPTSSYRQVNDRMKDLLAWLKDHFKKKDLYPPESALKFYCKFESIHPFMDGNGRVGRILLNAILEKFQYPHVIFFSENSEEHNSAIKAALDGRWDKIYKHFLKQVAKTDQAFMPKRKR